jgi:hypothetical protein
MSRNTPAILASLMMLAASEGDTIRYWRGEGYPDTSPKEPPDESARARKREKFIERGKRRYEHWLASQASR